MAILGLLLILLGAGIGLVVFVGLGYTTDGDRGREVAILSSNTTPEVVFALGIITGVLLLLGLWFMKSGAQRGWARRKRIVDLKAELEAERRENQQAPRTADRTETRPDPPPDGK